MLFRCILFAIALIPALNAIELKRVILSTNNNPLYIEFWPVVAPLWQAMGIKPTLALVADEQCPIDTSLGDVIRFPPMEGIPESLQAQVVRLFLPVLFPDDGCLIADIDMLPISKSYFSEGAKSCSEEAFLVYRDGAEGCRGTRYPMCYVAANGRVFGSLFKISKYEEIQELVRQWAAAGFGWNTDELMLYSSVMEWERQGGQVVRLGHDVQGRLDRGNWKIDFNSLDISRYIDCHCPRPYSAYRDSIDQVVKLINSQ